MSDFPYLTVDPGAGLIAPARQLPSPNHDERAPGATLDLIVIHGISLPIGRYGEHWVEALFTNQLPPLQHPDFAPIAHLRVAAHLYIRRDGEVVQFVPFHRRAWHAGVSSWRHRLACNDFSIGIELEGCDAEPYDPRQYPVLAGSILALREAYPTLRGSPLVGHSDIAPGRKTDPGPHFDWAQIRARVGDLA
jgi:N-acetyl-anhydromuramoyl-L-alanine amidase